MRHAYQDEEDLNEFELRKEVKDPRQKWIIRIIRSMRMYYKKCPYFDPKTNACFISFMGSDDKCHRDGKYEGCPVLEGFLGRRYDELRAKGKPVPYDFRDLTLY